MKETTRYHIMITDNEKKEIVADYDTDCIIGATDTNDHSTQCLACVNCDSMKLTHTIAGAQRLIESVLKEHPEVELLLKLKKLVEKDETDE